MNHIKLLIRHGMYHFADIELCCKVAMTVLDIKLIYHLEKSSTFSGYVQNYIRFNYEKQ